MSRGTTVFFIHIAELDGRVVAEVHALELAQGLDEHQALGPLLRRAGDEQVDQQAAGPAGLQHGLAPRKAATRCAGSRPAAGPDNIQRRIGNGQGPRPAVSPHRRLPIPEKLQVARGSATSGRRRRAALPRNRRGRRCDCRPARPGRGTSGVTESMLAQQRPGPPELKKRPSRSSMTVTLAGRSAPARSSGLARPARSAAKPGRHPAGRRRRTGGLPRRPASACRRRRGRVRTSRPSG